MFCHNCGALMYSENEKFVCSNCNFSLEKFVPKYKSKIKLPKNHGIKVIDDSSTLPKTSAKCSKCDNTEAYWYMRQLRGGDEPETRFYICTKCKWTWRESD